MRYYLDTEFDGHAGPLLSLALVAEDGLGFHASIVSVRATDPWVQAHVEPLMDRHDADVTAILKQPNQMGGAIRSFIELSSKVGDDRHTIIADSPVDIGRFCAAVSTAEDGGWASFDGDIRFEVHDVACYPTALPGAVQHNAWWDAMALREKLLTASASGSELANTINSGPNQTPPTDRQLRDDGQ
jgi:hypothetical protein